MLTIDMKGVAWTAFVLLQGVPRSRFFCAAAIDMERRSTACAPAAIDPPIPTNQEHRRRRHRRRRHRGGLSPLVAAVAVAVTMGAAGMLRSISTSSSILVPGAAAAAAAETPSLRWQRQGRGESSNSNGAEDARQPSQQRHTPPLLLRQLAHLHVTLPPFLASPPWALPQGQWTTRALAPVREWGQELQGRLGRSRGLSSLRDRALNAVGAGAARVNATMGEVDACMESVAASAEATWRQLREECLQAVEAVEARAGLLAAQVEARRLAAVAAWVGCTTALDAQRRRLLWAVDAAVGEARAAVAIAAGRVIDLSQVLPEEEALALGLALTPVRGEWGLLSSASEGEDEEEAEAAATRRASLRRFRPIRLLLFWRRRPSLGAARSTDASPSLGAEEGGEMMGGGVVSGGMDSLRRARRRLASGGAGLGWKGELASVNERALRSVLRLAGEGEGDGWEKVTATEGVTVYRKYLDVQGGEGAAAEAEAVVCAGGAEGIGGLCRIAADGVVVVEAGAGMEEGAVAGGGGGVSRFACVKVS